MEMDMINTLRRNKMITGVLLLCWHSTVCQE